MKQTPEVSYCRYHGSVRYIQYIFSQADEMDVLALADKILDLLELPGYRDHRREVSDVDSAG